MKNFLNEKWMYDQNRSKEIYKITIRSHLNYINFKIHRFLTYKLSFLGCANASTWTKLAGFFRPCVLIWTSPHDNFCWLFALNFCSKSGAINNTATIMQFSCFSFLVPRPFSSSSGNSKALGYPVISSDVID